VDSSHRRFAIPTGRPAGACLPASSVSVDSNRSKCNSSHTYYLRLSPEPSVSMSRGSTYDVCHFLEPTSWIKQQLPTQSPRIVASRNSKE